MKRRFTLIITALMLMMTSLAWGQTRDEVVAYTLDGTITGGTNGYATESEITQNNLTWMVTGNTDISPWRIGGKSLSGVDRPVYSTGTMSDNITKIVVTHGTANNITVNSMTLIVSSNADFSNPTSTLTGDFGANTTTTFNRPAATDWTNKYYKIIYNVSVSGNTNRFIQFNSAVFYKESGGQETVATPTFSPAEGTYNEAQNVTISCTTDGATIHYTTNGDVPTTSSAVYSTPIAISQTTTVKAMAAKSGMNNSSIASATYTIEDAPTQIGDDVFMETVSEHVATPVATRRKPVRNMPKSEQTGQSLDGVKYAFYVKENDVSYLETSIELAKKNKIPVIVVRNDIELKCLENDSDNIKPLDDIDSYISIYGTFDKAYPRDAFEQRIYNLLNEISKKLCGVPDLFIIADTKMHKILTINSDTYQIEEIQSATKEYKGKIYINRKFIKTYGVSLDNNQPFLNDMDKRFVMLNVETIASELATVMYHTHEDTREHYMKMLDIIHQIVYMLFEY